MGAWLNVYGEAIYGTRASIFTQIPAWGKVTVKPGKIYLHVITWPGGSHQITIPVIKNTINKVYLLNDTATTCPYTIGATVVTITLPAIAPNLYASVAAVSVNGDPRASDSLYVNNSSTGILYSTESNWSYSSGRGLGDYCDDVHYTQTNGDYFEYSFNGIGVDYITERNSDEGQVDVYIDGALISTVNCSNTTRQVQQVVFHRDLTTGRHTIRAVKRSGTYMVFDALRIRVDPSAVPVIPVSKSDVSLPVVSLTIMKKGRRAVSFTAGGCVGMSVAVYGLDGVLLYKSSSRGPAVVWHMNNRGAEGVYVYSVTIARNGPPLTKSGVFHLAN